MHDWGYVVAGYALTGGALLAYLLSLGVRSRRARERAAAIASVRRADPS